MSVKASLKIVLKADDVVVAESDDPELWKYVFSRMTQQGKSQNGSEEGPSDEQEETTPLFSASQPSAESGTSIEGDLDQLINNFAETLDLDQEKVRGACDPTLEPPYIRLDKHYWQDFKSELPSRGTNAIPSIVIAASILVLWMDEIGYENPTLDEAQDVLRTIDTRDRNPGRGIENCKWLRKRNGGITLNPERTSMAAAVARAYCVGEHPDFGE